MDRSACFKAQGLHQMSTQWQFVESYDYERTYWSWRSMYPDGTIEFQSPSFGTYGLAVDAAIKRGFRPREQHWVVVTRHSLVHFRPGEPSVTVPIADPEPSLRTRTAGTNRRVARRGPAKASSVLSLAKPLRAGGR
jgi:hypothetical protein